MTFRVALRWEWMALLALTLAGLKIAGIFNYSWWVALSPVWLPYALFIGGWIIVVMFILVIAILSIFFGE